jgi:hypothetical protein
MPRPEACNSMFRQTGANPAVGPIVSPSSSRAGANSMTEVLVTKPNGGSKCGFSRQSVPILKAVFRWA